MPNRPVWVLTLSIHHVQVHVNSYNGCPVLWRKSIQIERQKCWGRLMRGGRWHSPRRETPSHTRNTVSHSGVWSKNCNSFEYLKSTINLNRYNRFFIFPKKKNCSINSMVFMQHGHPSLAYGNFVSNDSRNSRYKNCLNHFSFHAHKYHDGIGQWGVPPAQPNAPGHSLFIFHTFITPKIHHRKWTLNQAIEREIQSIFHHHCFVFDLRIFSVMPSQFFFPHSTAHFYDSRTVCTFVIVPQPHHSAQMDWLDQQRVKDTAVVASKLTKYPFKSQ